MFTFGITRTGNKMMPGSWRVFSDHFFPANWAQPEILGNRFHIVAIRKCAATNKKPLGFCRIPFHQRLTAAFSRTFLLQNNSLFSDTVLIDLLRIRTGRVSGATDKPPSGSKRIFQGQGFATCLACFLRVQNDSRDI